jgi:hypothetical protein
MPGKGFLAVRVLTEFRLGGRTHLPGERASLPYDHAMRLSRIGSVELVPTRGGRYRRRDMRVEDGNMGD